MDKTTDRYRHALGCGWTHEPINPDIEQHNDQRRQQCFEANRIRIQYELKQRNLISKNKGRKTFKTEQIKELCAKYGYDVRVFYRLKNGRTKVYKICSTWRLDDRGVAVCNARDNEGVKTMLTESRIIKRKTNFERECK